jgi:DNA polymerase (family 10)
LTLRSSLGRAHQLAGSVVREARLAGLQLDSLTAVGRLRRYVPEPGDVTLLGVAPAARHQEVLAAFARLPIVTAGARVDGTSITIGTDRGPVTVHLAAPEDAGAALVWYTGSRRHTTRLRDRARTAGLCFDGPRLTTETGAPIAIETEEQLYRRLGLPYIPPEIRESGEELDIAADGGLPRLVSELHVRGDLHMHTTWSDGRDTTEAMVLASRELGYEYVAITDHSERSGALRKVAATDIPRQRDEIEALRERVAGIEILHGIEAEILPDGTLDFDDETLAGFDIVLASLHDHAGHDGTRLTERYLCAIRHPLVAVITHPANRLPGFSPGYDVDFERLFEAAVATGTALEIDGAPGHLDLDGALARRATAAGVTLTIDSDAHRAEALAQQMSFGVAIARRGWVEPRHVLNTRSVGAVRDFVARKRHNA